MQLKPSPAKGSEHVPGPTWSDQRKGACLGRGSSTRSRGLHGLQECFCGDVSVNPTRDSAFCEQERVKPLFLEIKQLAGHVLLKPTACRAPLQLKAAGSELWCGTQGEGQTRHVHSSITCYLLMQGRMVESS